MIRTLIVLHRYLGIGLGVLVSLWCLSAFVMMYVRYPVLTEAEALTGLDTLDLAGCCRGMAEALGDGPVHAFRIEAVAQRPMLSIDDGGSRPLQIDLSTGAVVPQVDAPTAHAQAARYLANAGIEGAILGGAQIARDQWTVGSGFDVHRPLYRFRADHDAATELYVSGTTGEVVQQSKGAERFWNWFGSVVHWLYPVMLRQHPAVWIQIIIWTTVASLFLVVTGIWIGLRQYCARGIGHRSPYRGAALWHHYFGLVCGLLTVTWLASGLVSVNPWGFLETGSSENEQRRLAGTSIKPDALKAVLEALQRSAQSAQARPAVRIESSLFGGEFALVSYGPDGEFVRLDPETLDPWPVTQQDLARSAAMLSTASAPVASATMMSGEDNYYFSHHEKVRLPVYRVILDDGDRTRYYLHPDTGRLLMKVDANGRRYRWLFGALHRGDFAGWLRRRPLWDVALGCLLLGVTVSAVTGTYLGGRRLVRNRSGIRRPGAGAATAPRRAK
jgi:hypothetical protein